MMSMTTPLAWASFLAGLILALLAGLLLALPQQSAALLKAFPRHVWAGRALAAITILWSAWLLFDAHFGWVDANRMLVYGLIPVAYLVIIFFADDLLAARAFGGLLLLLPLPLLEAAFIHPSTLRLVITVFAYALAIVGMALVWSPYLFRQWTARWIAQDRLKAWIPAATGLAGLILLALGLTAY